MGRRSVTVYCCTVRVGNHLGRRATDHAWNRQRGLDQSSWKCGVYGYFKQLSGSAASLFTVLMFALGSSLGALTSLLFDGSLLPMASMMLLATTVSNVLAQSVFREPMPARD